MFWSTWLKKQSDRERVNKFFNSLETRAVVIDDKVYLLVYNERYPELSYIITEQL